MAGWRWCWILAVVLKMVTQREGYIFLNKKNSRKTSKMLRHIAFIGFWNLCMKGKSIEANGISISNQISIELIELIKWLISISSANRSAIEIEKSEFDWYSINSNDIHSTLIDIWSTSTSIDVRMTLIVCSINFDLVKLLNC